MIQEGLFFDNDTLIPTDMVKQATETRIDLSVPTAKIEDLSAEYRESHFVSASPPKNRSKVAKLVLASTFIYIYIYIYIYIDIYRDIYI